MSVQHLLIVVLVICVVVAVLGQGRVGVEPVYPGALGGLLLLILILGLLFGWFR